jgi:hypothetical protein
MGAYFDKWSEQPLVYQPFKDNIREECLLEFGKVIREDMVSSTQWSTDYQALGWLWFYTGIG